MGVIGTLLNTGAILAGGAAGLAFGPWLSTAVQQKLRLGLAGLVIYAGFSMVGSGLAGSGWATAVQQLIVALAALSLGSLTGHLLGLQRGVGRMGRWAKERFSTASKATAAGTQRPDPIEGFLTCTLLFCVGPMAILGPVQDGLEGRWQVLAVKSLMDGLSTMGFVAAFGWSPLLAAVPVLLYQGSITLAARKLEPLLYARDLKDAINITGGLIVVSIAFIILDVRKVPLANYLPALIWAPLLAHWWK